MPTIRTPSPPGLTVGVLGGFAPYAGPPDGEAGSPPTNLLWADDGATILTGDDGTTELLAA